MQFRNKNTSSDCCTISLASESCGWSRVRCRRALYLSLGRVEVLEDADSGERVEVSLSKGSVHYNTMKFQVILYKRHEICFKYVSSHHNPEAGQEMTKMFTVTVESPGGEAWLTASFLCQNVLSLRQQCLVSVADSVSHRPSRDNLTSLAIPNILRLELQQIFISLWTETKDSSDQDFLTRKRAVKIVDI